MTRRAGRGSGGAIRHVVFDWNGTLIDDFGLAVETVNQLRREHAMAEISHSDYRQTFRFPISKFYQELGFVVEREAFARLMERYLQIFNARIDACALHPGVRELVARLRAAGVGVHILSASHRDTLAQSLRAKNLEHAFDEVVGLGHELAHGKLELAAWLAERLGGEPERVVYVGDTDHDYEVARAQRWQFVFVAHGHQALPADAPHRAHAVASLDELLGMLVV